jgi:predicted RNase H-like HicB family nuclease
MERRNMMAEADDVAKYMAKPYSRVVVPHPPGGCFAEVLEFPGCFTQGDTPEEAVKNLEEAMVGWLSAAIDSGQAIPEPLALRGYSGHVALRMPKSLHREAVRRAELEGVSLNQYLVTAVGAYVAGQNAASGATAGMVVELARRTTTTTVEQLVVTNVPGLPLSLAPGLPGELIEADAGNYVVMPVIRRRKRHA